VTFFNPTASTSVFAKVDFTFGQDIDGVGGKGREREPGGGRARGRCGHAPGAVGQRGGTRGGPGAGPERRLAGQELRAVPRRGGPERPRLPRHRAGPAGGDLAGADAGTSLAARPHRARGRCVSRRPRGAASHGAGSATGSRCAPGRRWRSRSHATDSPAAGPIGPLWAWEGPIGSPPTARPSDHCRTVVVPYTRSTHRDDFVHTL